MAEYIAHRNDVTGLVQTVKEHSENTAALCRDYAVPELKEIAYAAGLLHDVGKYQYSFTKRMDGANIRVEHSTCGALAVKDRYSIKQLALLMEYCIAGHHSGIPDGGFSNEDSSLSTLHGRMQRAFEDFSQYKKELAVPELDGREFLKYLLANCNNNMDKVIDKFAFLTRYVFSCLVDADSTDTAEFCREKELPRKLRGNFNDCLKKVDHKLKSFICETELQKSQGKSSKSSLFKQPERFGSLLNEYAYRQRKKLWLVLKLLWRGPF